MRNKLELMVKFEHEMYRNQYGGAIVFLRKHRPNPDRNIYDALVIARDRMYDAINRKASR